VKKPRLFATRHRSTQLRLFTLGGLGENGWLKALRLDEYVPRKLQRPVAMQQALFAYAEAL
jgi:hypothetical protein